MQKSVYRSSAIGTMLHFYIIDHLPDSVILPFGPHRSR